MRQQVAFWYENGWPASVGFARQVLSNDDFTLVWHIGLTENTAESQAALLARLDDPLEIVFETAYRSFAQRSETYAQIVRRVRWVPEFAGVWLRGDTVTVHLFGVSPSAAALCEKLSQTHGGQVVFEGGTESFYRHGAYGNGNPFLPSPAQIGFYVVYRVALPAAGLVLGLTALAGGIFLGVRRRF